MTTQLRGHFVDELKRAQVPAEDVRLVFELPDISPPITSGPGNQHEFEEVCFLTALRRYAPDLSQLPRVIKPDQLMVNGILKQMTAAANTVPPYVPFVTIALSAFPDDQSGQNIKEPARSGDLEYEASAPGRTSVCRRGYNIPSGFSPSSSLKSMSHPRGPSCPTIRPSGGTVNGSRRISTDNDRVRSKTQELCFRNELVKRRVLAENAQKAQLRSKLPTNPGEKGKRS